MKPMLHELPRCAKPHPTRPDTFGCAHEAGHTGPHKLGHGYAYWADDIGEASAWVAIEMIRAVHDLPGATKKADRNMITRQIRELSQMLRDCVLVAKGSC